MMDEMTLTLSSPITEEQFDAITDVDFDNTDRIWFHTKNGKDVEFVKRKKGKYTKEELTIFAHGISLSLLSKRSAQHWHYDDDTAKEIEFLETLYKKVQADMREDSP